MRAHVCRAASAGAGAPGAGAHVFRAPGAVQECRAPGVVQKCRAPGAGAHVCRSAGAGTGAGAGAAGPGAGAGAGVGPSPLITVHPPTKLYFCQSRASPEPQNKYILNDTGTIPEGKKVSTRDDIGKVRYCAKIKAT